jgi:hypothetical protein
MSATNAAACVAQSVAPVVFVMLELDSGTLRMHDSIGTIVWGSQNWLGVGDFGGISGWEEGSDISPYGFELSLSYIDATLSTEVMAETIANRPVTVYQGFLDVQHGTLVDDPDVLFSGRTDVPLIRVGSQVSQVRVACETDVARVLGRPPVAAVYSHATQQALYSGDLAFEYLERIQDIVVKWGGRPVAYRPPTLAQQIGSSIAPRFTF